jgi:hypothetical protein
VFEPFPNFVSGFKAAVLPRSPSPIVPHCSTFSIWFKCSSRFLTAVFFLLNDVQADAIDDENEIVVVGGTVKPVGRDHLEAQWKRLKSLSDSESGDGIAS